MLRIHSYDEIAGEWAIHALNLAATERDPINIAHALDLALGLDPNNTEEATWNLTSALIAGDDMVLSFCSERGHRAKCVLFGYENR